jgi:NAD(P)-dependent dehydrogenase (short-subunit alcohol dehydrogenase family)
VTAPIALITGAGSGIGRATALALAEAGYQTVLVGRRRAALDAVAAQIGPAALAIPTDVADAASVDALFARIEQVHGRLDLLFNNAGLSLPATPLHEIALDDWNRLVSVNLTGAFLCLQGAFRLMVRQSPQGGRIINNGSLSAHVPRLHSAAYTATTHAISGLTKSAALDGRAFGIACGQIDIGNAATDMATGSMTGALQPDGRIVPEPVIDVSLVANAVVQMAALPLAANVQTMTIMATAMPYVGRG